MLMQNFIAFGTTEGIGRVPMRNLLLWQSWRHWACAHAKFYCFWQNWRHSVCAHAKFNCFWENWMHWAWAHAKFYSFWHLVWQN